MVIAIGPQNAERDSGIMAEDGGERRQHHRPRAPHRSLDDRLAGASAGGDVGLDLIDQDDGVAHDHAGKRDQAEQRHEAERPVGDVERRSEAPMMPSGAVMNTRIEPREALQLDHQERQHDDRP